MTGLALFPILNECADTGGDTTVFAACAGGRDIFIAGDWATVAGCIDRFVTRP